MLRFQLSGSRSLEVTRRDRACGRPRRAAVATMLAAMLWSLAPSPPSSL